MSSNLKQAEVIQTINGNFTNPTGSDAGQPADVKVEMNGSQPQKGNNDSTGSDAGQPADVKVESNDGSTKANSKVNVVRSGKGIFQLKPIKKEEPKEEPKEKPMEKFYRATCTNIFSTLGDDNDDVNDDNDNDDNDGKEGKEEKEEKKAKCIICEQHVVDFSSFVSDLSDKNFTFPEKKMNIDTSHSYRECPCVCYCRDAGWGMYLSKQDGYVSLHEHFRKAASNAGDTAQDVIKKYIREQDSKPLLKDVCRSCNTAFHAISKLEAAEYEDARPQRELQAEMRRQEAERCRKIDEELALERKEKDERQRKLTEENLNKTQEEWDEEYAEYIQFCHYQDEQKLAQELARHLDYEQHMIRQEEELEQKQKRKQGFKQELKLTRRQEQKLELDQLEQKFQALLLINDEKVFEMFALRLFSIPNFDDFKKAVVNAKKLARSTEKKIAEEEKERTKVEGFIEWAGYRRYVVRQLNVLSTFSEGTLKQRLKKLNNNILALPGYVFPKGWAERILLTRLVDLNLEKVTETKTDKKTTPCSVEQKKQYGQFTHICLWPYCKRDCPGRGLHFGHKASTPCWHGDKCRRRCTGCTQKTPCVFKDKSDNNLGCCNLIHDGDDSVSHDTKTLTLTEAKMIWEEEALKREERRKIAESTIRVYQYFCTRENCRPWKCRSYHKDTDECKAGVKCIRKCLGCRGKKKCIFLDKCGREVNCCTLLHNGDMVKVKGEDGEVELITPRQANERLRELETKNRAELLKEERADNAKKQQEAAERKEAKQQEEEQLAQEERTTRETMAARKAVSFTASSSVLCPSSSTSSSSSSSSASSASSVSSSSSSSAPPVSSAVAERKSNEEKARLTAQQASFDRIKSSFEANPNTKVTKADLDFLNNNFNYWDALFAEAKALREAISEQDKKTWIIDSDSEDSDEFESDRKNEVKKAELSPEEKKRFADLTNVYLELKSSFDNDLARKLSLHEKVKMDILKNDFEFSEAEALVVAFFEREEKLKKEAKLKKNL